MDNFHIYILLDLQYFVDKFYIHHSVFHYNLKDVHEQILELVVADIHIHLVDYILVVDIHLEVVVEFLQDSIYHKHQNRIVYNKKKLFLYTFFCINHISNLPFVLKLNHVDELISFYFHKIFYLNNSSI